MAAAALPFRTATLVRDSKSVPPSGTGAEHTSHVRTPGPSCQALRYAVSNLYRLDDFECEKIGSGFFSDVYKAVHKANGHVLVLKMNTMPSNRLNVLREVEMMNGFSHPNILRFIGVCVNEGQLHAVVEYINGGTLEELLANKSRDLLWPVRVRLACDVAKGLKYLHARGVMHRDLTSKNILIKEGDGRMVAIVADFGLATKIPDPLQEKQLSIVGSPYWMAPECIVGKKYNEKADVFSYGIVQCEIIARVDADPEILPRTNKFGVDYVAFSKMAADCPLHFLHLAFICCQIEPRKRPSFAEIVERLEEMKCSALMAVILADLSRLGISSSSAGNIMSRMILERILDGKRQDLARQSTSCVGGGETPNSQSPLPPSANRRIVPVTSITIGKVMSKDDAHYAPHGDNPFPSRFRNAGAKIGLGAGDDSDLLLSSSFDLSTPPPTPLSPLESRDATPRPSARLYRRHSLPSSTILRGSHTFTYADIDSDGASSADSALEFDTAEGSSGSTANLRRRSVGRAEMMIRCLEDLEALFDSSADLSFQRDGSSCASIDEAVFSPTSSFSSRDGGTVDAFHTAAASAAEPRGSYVGSHERFRELLQRWEVGQKDVVLPARLRYGDPYLMQKFREVRRMWEEQQEKFSNARAAAQTATLQQDVRNASTPPRENDTASNASSVPQPNDVPNASANLHRNNSLKSSTPPRESDAILSSSTFPQRNDVVPHTSTLLHRNNSLKSSTPPRESEASLTSSAVPQSIDVPHASTMLRRNNSLKSSTPPMRRTSPINASTASQVNDPVNTSTPPTLTAGDSCTSANPANNSSPSVSHREITY